MKIAVYTALFGDKDELLPPLNYQYNENISYYLFTDTAQNIFPYTTIVKPRIFDDVSKNAFYYKHMGDDIINNYDMLIWHDANIQLYYDKLNDLIDIGRNSFLSIFIHPDRDDFYSEAMTSIRVDKDFSLRILRQALYYFIKGMPAHAGMFATGILIKNQNIDSGNFYAMWWEHTLEYSRRDQLSIVYICYKTKQKINVIEGDIFNNVYSKYYLHKYKHYIEKNQVMKYNYGFLKKLSYFCVKLMRKIKKWEARF